MDIIANRNADIEALQTRLDKAETENTRLTQALENIVQPCQACKPTSTCYSCLKQTANAALDHTVGEIVELDKSEYDFVMQELSRPPQINENVKELMKTPLIFEKEVGEMVETTCYYCGTKDVTYKNIKNGAYTCRDCQNNITDAVKDICKPKQEG